MPLTRVRRAQVFGDDWGVAAQTVTLTHDVAPHTHDFVELVFVLDGTLAHASRMHAKQMEPGDVMCVRPGSWHALQVPRRAVVGNVYLAQELLLTELAWLVAKGPASLLLCGGEGQVANSHDVMDAVGRLAASVGNTLERAGLLACVLATLESAPPHPQPGWEPQLAALMADVTRDLTADWTIARLARRLHLSPSHFRRLFTAAVGRSPVDWLAETRAEAMAVALVSTDVPIYQVAREVGWTDPNYASRRFRQLRGLAPTRYRQRYRFER